MKKVIVISLLCLVGCRTVKTSQKANEEMKKHLELNTLAVKAATREWDVLTYWGDGGVYRLEQMRERVDEAGLAEMNSTAHRSAKQQETLKEREPVKWLVYVSIAMIAIFLVCAVVYVYWKLI